MVKVEDVYKRYRLGLIGGGTLAGDLQSWWAKVRHKEDPNSKIGAKVYGKNETFYALNGISFEVRKGEALGIIGGNGAGKSTTLKLLSQVTAPTSGKIYLNGRVASMLEVGTGFHPELTGRENIYLNGAILGMTKAEIDKKVEEIIDFSECRQFIDTPVKRYSSGMYVKLAFSVAAHLDSEIMIMDEVLAVGDVRFQQKCLKKMRDIARQEGRTILYVSHNMNTIRSLCDRCIVLEQGNVAYDGITEEAIQIYSKNEIDTMCKNYDFRGVKRTDASERDIFMERLNLISVDEEKLVFDLLFNAKRKMKHVLMRFVVKDKNENSVGTSYSQLYNVEAGANKYRFTLDTSNLSVNSYITTLILIEYKDNIQVRQDVVENEFAFEIMGDGFYYDTKWYADALGYVRFKDIKSERID